jgi:pimeloyl-ACP methyl ester carboxylesterase
VVDAIGDRRGLIVVGQSYGGLTAPLVADRVPVDAVVFVAGMIPAPGEKPADWWSNTGYQQAVDEQAGRDGGLTGNDDPFVAFYHDLPRALAEEALSKERSESDTAYNSPWPLDALPAVPTKFVVCTEDRVLPDTIHAAASWRASRHRSRRDRGWPLRGARPPAPARRPA